MVDQLKKKRVFCWSIYKASFLRRTHRKKELLLNLEGWPGLAPPAVAPGRCGGGQPQLRLGQPRLALGGGEGAAPQLGGVQRPPSATRPRPPPLRVVCTSEDGQLNVYKN